MAVDILYNIVYYFNTYLGPFELCYAWLENQKSVKNYFTVFMIDGLFVLINVANAMTFLKETLLFLFNFLIYTGIFVVFRTYFLSSIFKNTNNTEIKNNSFIKVNENSETETETESDHEFETENKNDLDKETDIISETYNMSGFKFTFGSPKKTIF